MPDPHGPEQTGGGRSVPARPPSSRSGTPIALTTSNHHGRGHRHRRPATSSRTTCQPLALTSMQEPISFNADDLRAEKKRSPPPAGSRMISQSVPRRGRHGCAGTRRCPRTPRRSARSARSEPAGGPWWPVSAFRHNASLEAPDDPEFMALREHRFQRRLGFFIGVACSVRGPVPGRPGPQWCLQAPYPHFSPSPAVPPGWSHFRSRHQPEILQGSLLNEGPKQPGRLRSDPQRSSWVGLTWIL